MRARLARSVHALGRWQVFETQRRQEWPASCSLQGMLAVYVRQRPPVHVAHQQLASVFGPAAVRTGGTVFTHLEARGTLRGLAVTSERLASKAAVGAPRALVARMTHGPIGDRLGAIGITRLTIGSEAKRDECATRGVHLEVEGWPMDEATLRFMIDTALDVALATRHETAAAAGWPGGRHPEVVANETARASSRKQGLKVAAAVFAGLTTLTVLVVAAMIRLM